MKPVNGAAGLAVCVIFLAGCGGGSGDDSDASGSPDAQGTAAEGPLLPDAFKGVCSGATVSDATAYDEGAASHKILLFETHEDDLTDASHRLPPDSTIQFAATGNPLADIDLVACSVRTADKLANTCDGYESDGKPTDNKVRWHTGTYEVAVRAATTGEELASTTLQASDEECPMFAQFESDSETIDMYDSVPDSRLNDFLKPLVQK